MKQESYYQVISKTPLALCGLCGHSYLKHYAWMKQPDRVDASMFWCYGKKDESVDKVENNVCKCMAFLMGDPGQ